MIMEVFRLPYRMNVCCILPAIVAHFRLSQ